MRLPLALSTVVLLGLAGPAQATLRLPMGPSGSWAVEPGPVVYVPVPTTRVHVPGVCFVPAWEYHKADFDRNGITTSQEVSRYCRRH